MKRQLTALLLAMTFVLATVSPTLAAKPAKESGNRTATVSVEKPRKEKSRVGAFFAKLLPSKSMRSTEGSRETSRTVVNAPAPSSEEETQGAEAVKEFKNLFSLLDESGKNIDGAGLRIVKDGSDHGIVEHWTSGQSEIEVSLPAGKYIFENSSVTPGYKQAKPVSFEVNSEGTITGADDHLKEIGKKKVLVLEAEKQDGKTFFGIKDKLGNYVTGATLQIKVKGSETALHEWTTGSRSGFYELRPGDYVLLQSEAPEGYEKADPIEFTIDEHGKINPEPKQLKMIENDQCLILEAKKETGKLFFSLRGVGDKELAGANVKIKQDGKTLDETFETKDKPFELPRAEGKYELTVTHVPEGYKSVNDTIKFEINEKGELKVDDKYLDKKDGNETLFLKADPIGDQFFFRLKDSTGKDIIGAELQIKDSTGKVIKWISGKNPKGIDIQEFPDGDYEFSQTTVPTVPYGHTAAEPIRFTVKDKKIVQPTYALTDFGPYQELALVSKNAKRVVTFSRVDVSGKALLGNEIEIYKDGIKIVSWKSGSDSTKLELEPGVYKYHEASAATGHKVAKDFDFEMKADGTITLNNVQAGENVKLKEGGLIVVGESAGAPVEDPNKKPETKPADKPGQGKTKGSAQVQNVWVEFSIANKSGVELSGATVEILQNGKSVASWTTSTTSYKVKLQPGSYRFHTKTAPQGYQLARDFNFAVNRDGSIALGKIQSGDTVAAKDGKITVYGDPVTATGARATGTSQGTQANNGKLPKTGDGISPVVYAAGLAAVGAVVLGIGIKKRRQSVDEAK